MLIIWVKYYLGFSVINLEIKINSIVLNIYLQYLLIILNFKPIVMLYNDLINNKLLISKLPNMLYIFANDSSKLEFLLTKRVKNY